jgi:hypothetical protein
MFTKRALFFSTLYLLLMGSPVLVPALALADTATTTAATSTTPALDPYNSTDVATAVRSYFADIPVMAAIAKCESSFTQYNTNGSVLKGGSGGMIGVFQINKSVHAKFALSLGDDITTLAGNMTYARYLYNNEGTEPWDSSKGCWGSVVSAGVQQAASSTVPALTQNLKVGSTGAQVTTLQQLLNTAGYKIAKTGAGSPGQETSTFGPATKLAVERFQCAHNITCSGSEGTTGFGYVGVKTRAALVLN